MRRTHWAPSAALPPPLPSSRPPTPPTAHPRTAAMASELADVPAPFTTKLTQEQIGEYRKRKVALISGACCPLFTYNMLSRWCLIGAQVLRGRMVHICESPRPFASDSRPVWQEPLLVRHHSPTHSQTALYLAPAPATPSVSATAGMHAVHFETCVACGNVELSWKYGVPAGLFRAHFSPCRRIGKS